MAGEMTATVVKRHHALKDIHLLLLFKNKIYFGNYIILYTIAGSVRMRLVHFTCIQICTFAQM